MPPKTGDASEKMLDKNHSLLFKQVLQNYETKEYKKGLKNADLILKKYPNHGETMAMKGLILTNVDRKEEGWESVRKGLRNDLKSHICWHVYGLLYRAERNYEESMKCYLNALKYDPDNLVVLRDLAVIQSQLRIFPGLVDTRRNLVVRQPEVRGHHTALAVAYYLNKDYANAEKVLRTYDEKMVIQPPKNDPEQSMMALYLNTVIATSGDSSKALKHLEIAESQILDKLEVSERKAQYHLNLCQFESAKKIYEHLLDLNPDCHRYYHGLDRASGFRDEDGAIIEDRRQALTEAYTQLQSKYPRASVPKRLPLAWLSGDAFETAIDKYLRKLLQKGVPSTFVDVKALYVVKEKADIIERLAESYIDNLKSSSFSKLNGETNGVDTQNDDAREAPTSYLWTLYFLAQSYDYRGNLARAMELIDEAIAHTPTLVELHMTKARILKHTGSPHLAAERMNIARELDLQDRFINTKSTKYYLRADQNGEATNTISLFLNSTLGGGSIGDLQEMQSVSFLLEDGLSYARQGLLGLALKRFEGVRKVLDQWYEDEFDFHQYCFRKGTIDAYVRSMAWESTIYSHHIYRRASEGAVRALLRLHQKPELKQGPIDKEGMGETEKKKEKKRIQKIRARCAKDATKEAEKKDGIDMHRKLDQDPLGDKLVSTETPLEDALRYLKPWLRDAPGDKKALSLAAEVYLEQSNLSEALTVLSKLDPRESHLLLYKFRACAESSQAPVDSKISDLLASHFGDQSVGEWNDQHLSSCATTEELISGLAVLVSSSAESSPLERIESEVFDHKLSMDTTSLSQARELHGLLMAQRSSRADEYRLKVKQIWVNAEEKTGGI